MYHWLYVKKHNLKKEFFCCLILGEKMKYRLEQLFVVDVASCFTMVEYGKLSKLLK